MSKTYQVVWNFMKGTPGVMVPNTKAGMNKVLKDDYAFFAESTTVEYQTERNCNLMKVGGVLNTIGYGFALPQGECGTP